MCPSGDQRLQGPNSQAYPVQVRQHGPRAPEADYSLLSLGWRRLHPQFYLRRDGPNAGTPAVLYPRQRLQGAIGYVEQKINTPTPFDLVLGKYRQNQGLVGHLLEPNLVRHIGVSSVFDAAHESDRDGKDKREFQLKYPI